MSETKPPIINLDELEYFENREGSQRFGAKIGLVSNVIGANKLGYSITVLSPGKRAWPYHSHNTNEEMFFVIEGQGTLRHADQEYPIKAGDFISSPADLDQPHQIVNDSDQDLKYIAVSTMLEPEVCFYPDSNKFLVIAGSAPGAPDMDDSFRVVGTKGETRDYWEGED